MSSATHMGHHRVEAARMAVSYAGLAFHHAALEPADRSTVEALFKDRKIAVLCTTSTLAVGVNLPAHLASLRPKQCLMAGA